MDYDQENPVKPKRRWFQYRLKNLRADVEGAVYRADNYRLPLRPLVRDEEQFGVLSLEDRSAVRISELLATQPGAKAISLGSQGVIVVEQFKLVPAEVFESVAMGVDNYLVEAAAPADTAKTATTTGNDRTMQTTPASGRLLM